MKTLKQFLFLILVLFLFACTPESIEDEQFHIDGQTQCDGDNGIDENVGSKN